MSEKPDDAKSLESQDPTTDAVRETSGEPVAVRTGMFGVTGSGDTSGYGGLTRTVEMPGATLPPYDGWHDEVFHAIEERGAAAGIERPVQSVVEHAGEITFHVRREDVATLVRVLRDDPGLRFEMCTSLSGVHYPEEAGRELHVVYHLLSITHNRRIRLEVTCPDDDPHVPSVVATYPAMDWHERETWDFFGIVFDAHPALTRIEMPDDWPGHPQRKDYPLGGIPVEYKGATIPPPDERRSYN